MVPVHTLVFVLLALIAIGSSAMVAFSRNIIHATVALLGTFVGVAGMYLQLSADFLAAVQILVYVGGTLTLLLFAVMLTTRIESVRNSNLSSNSARARIVTMLLAFVIIKALLVMPFRTQERPASVSTVKLGHALLGEYLFPFELASFLLLGALVGAVVLARKATREEVGEVGSGQ